MKTPTTTFKLPLPVKAMLIERAEKHYNRKFMNTQYLIKLIKEDYDGDK